MRKTSIEELPQLVNVLFGHMTLVGPRPESSRSPGATPRSSGSFPVRPGFHGPCQVVGARREGPASGPSTWRGFYLTKPLPHRVGKGLDYLKDPSLARTVQWLVVTFRSPGCTATRPLGATQPEFAGAGGARQADRLTLPRWGGRRGSGRLCPSHPRCPSSGTSPHGNAAAAIGPASAIWTVASQRMAQPPRTDDAEEAPRRGPAGPAPGPSRRLPRRKASGRGASSSEPAVQHASAPRSSSADAAPGPVSPI